MAISQGFMHHETGYVENEFNDIFYQLEYASKYDFPTEPQVWPHQSICQASGVASVYVEQGFARFGYAPVTFLDVTDTGLFSFMPADPPQPHNRPPSTKQAADHPVEATMWPQGHTFGEAGPFEHLDLQTQAALDAERSEHPRAPSADSEPNAALAEMAPYGSVACGEQN